MLPRVGFQSDAGPWTVLAADALVEDEGSFKPDFSACAGSEHLRCLRISKAIFDTITSRSKQEDDAVSVMTLQQLESVDSASTSIGRSNSNIGNSNGVSGNGSSGAGQTKAHSEGGERGRGRISPARSRKGVTCGASLKILQAVAGASVGSAQDTAEGPPGSGEQKRSNSWVSAFGGVEEGAGGVDDDRDC